MMKQITGAVLCMLICLVFIVVSVHRRYVLQSLSPGRIRININQCSRGELEVLPHISEKRALAIFKRRSGKEIFLLPSDLEHIRGIGPGISRKISPYIDF